MKSSASVFLCFLLILASHSGSSLAQSTTDHDSARHITAQIDDSQRVTLRGNVHPLAQPQFDRGPAPSSDPTGRIQLLLRRSTAQQQALTQYLSELQNPSSPAFHKWTTPAQYGAQFGVDIADMQTVESWLQSHGFRIEKVPASRNLIEFSGTIDQVQSTFHTSIHSFAIQGEMRFANVTDPQIPAALVPLIAGIGPLNNFRSRSNIKISAKGAWNTTTHSIQPNLTLFDRSGDSYLFVDPADAATIYDSPNSALNFSYTAGTSYTGKGATIGIVGVSNLYMQDILNYRTAFLGESTSSANLPNVIIDGNDPGIDTSGAGVEALLDNEVAGGLAPGARINFYISAGSDLSDGLMNAILRAVDDNAIDILSVSFGACESALGTSGNQLILEISEQAAAQGISVTVSAGDNGSAGCDNFDTGTTAQLGLAVSGYASTPYTIAVGGTDFDVLPSSFSTYADNTTSGSVPYYRTAMSYIPENPWNDSTTINTTISENTAYTNQSGETNIVAGSGGVSSIYTKPEFQTSLTPADGHRDLPDVSLFAGNGMYSALWALCSDTVADGTGVTTPSSDCANAAGQFSSSTTFSGVGGTSASAPAFAGMLALAVQSTGGRLGQADTVLYQLAKAHPSYFHDITSGDNSVPCASNSPDCGSNGFLSGYNASTGYDLATGLGSVDAAAIVNNWKSVSFKSTSTTIQINGSSATYSGVHGADLTFSSGVASSSGTPTGIVAVTDNAGMTTGGTASGPQNNGQIAIPLTAGSGSVTYNGLPGGSYAVTARYGGDTTFAASTSDPITVSIAPESSTTNLNVNAYDSLTGKAISNSNIPYGSYVIADADITGTAEGSKTQGTATGTVTFMNGSATLGTGTVSSGSEASWPPLNSSYTAIAVGNYNLTAKYSGDASYSPSTGTASFTIAKAPTMTTAGFSGTPVEYGNEEQIGADVLTNSFGVAPTGTFQYQIDGQAALGPQSIYESGGYSNTNGKNNWALADTQTIYTFLSLGQHTLSATYSGDSNYASSASAAANVTVTQAQPFFNGLGWNIPNPPAAIGQQITVTAQLFGSEQGVSPTGTITFFDNANAISGTVTYSGRAAGGNIGSLLQASMPYTFTSAGSHTLTASYSGDTYYLPAASSYTNLSETVNVDGPISLSAGSVTISAPGQSGSSTVTITPNNGFTGAVNLSCKVSTSMSSYRNLPTCSVPASVTISGTNAATATLTVNTTASSTAALRFPLHRFLAGGGGVTLAIVLLFGIPTRRRAWRALLGVFAVVIIAGAIGCGGSGGGGNNNTGTTAGSYTITVTGTDAATGKITASATVYLTVD
jgi:hypothetical protein